MELADVEVVDHLVDQVAGVLEDEDVALDVAGEAEAAEDVLAEAVGGGDGGGVEVGQGGGEAPAALVDLGRRAGGEEPEDVVVLRWSSPAATRRRPCSALTRRSRTRSRSSPVAMRVKVTSSSWSSGMPSAT